jgi:YD repeat-containing protein
MTSLTDADGNTTSYTFDHLNRLTGDTDANSNSDSYSYNAAGWLTSQTDKNGRVTDFSYDNLGRMTQEQWISGGSAIYTATWAYDAASNLTSASDNNSDYAYSYNSDNLVTQIDNNSTPTGPHVVLNIGYDHTQRETSESATVAGTLDFLNNYSYNADSAITQKLHSKYQRWSASSILIFRVRGTGFMTWLLPSRQRPSRRCLGVVSSAA